MRPSFRITAGDGGGEISGFLDQVNVSIVVRDAAGIESDRVDVTVDDFGGRIADIETGRKLAVELGYDNQLAYMGLYEVDTVDYEHDGRGQVIRFSARAADLRGNPKERRTQDYEGQTFGQILSEVAARMGLPARVHPELADIELDYISQDEESDIAFATRLGGRFGATVAPKNGMLVAVPRGRAGIGAFQIRRPGNLLTWKVSYFDKAKFSEVEGSWFERGEAERKTIKVPATNAGPIFRIREPLPNQSQAEAMARAKANDLLRAQASGIFVIHGDPSAAAEMDAMVSGCRSKVDGLWNIETVTHRWADKALTEIACKHPV